MPALQSGLDRLLADPDLRRQLIERGFEPQALSPAEWGAFMAAETRRWGELIRKADLKAQ